MAEAKHHAGEGRFRIPRIDMVLRDGDPVTLGQTTVTVLETPGHTWGTCSYMYPVFLAGERHTGVTIGGQGLNAMDDPKQLAAYIASMKRLGSDELGIDVDLTAHPFSTGLTELIPAVRSWKPGSAHPLVSRPDYLARLDRLIRRAEGYVKR